MGGGSGDIDPADRYSSGDRDRRELDEMGAAGALGIEDRGAHRARKAGATTVLLRKNKSRRSGRLLRAIRTTFDHPVAAMRDPIIPEGRRGGRPRDLVEQPLSAAPLGTVRTDEPTWLRIIPGWPSRGKFSRADKENIAREYRSAVAVATDLILGLHLVKGSSAPRDRQRLKAIAYDLLYTVNLMLRSVTKNHAAPTFQVAHAALRQAGWKLPPRAEDARRTLKRIVARVRQEQATAPTGAPPRAGVACRRYPGIALAEHETRSSFSASG
jgi:hypothetical protein